MLSTDNESLKGLRVLLYGRLFREGGDESIVLTRNEVDHVRENPEKSAFVVVLEIELDRTEGECVASGGKVITHEKQWTIDES
jgi:hypothetical protein